MKHTSLAVHVLLIGCLWFSGCVIGPTTKEIRETMEPAGVNVTVHLRDGAVTAAELLTVSSDEIAVLTVQGVAFFPVEVIDRLTTEEPPVTARPQAGQISAEDMAELRPLSRFPAGFPPGVLDKLIERHGTYDVPEGAEGSQ